MFGLIRTATSSCMPTVRHQVRLAMCRAASTQTKTVEEIREVITEKIRPSIQEHGGDLEFISYSDNIVRVRLQGACSTCPSSIVTLKNGVKSMLQYYVPEVKDVEEVTDDQPPV